jgi:hypothetical protein
MRRRVGVIASLAEQNKQRGAGMRARFTWSALDSAGAIDDSESIVSTSKRHAAAAQTNENKVYRAAIVE